MRKLLLSLFIGIAAGIVDVIPMIIQRLDWYSCTSAFFQWLFLGIIINHVEIGLKGWLKGLIIAEASVIPILIIISKTELMTVIPITVMTGILGSLVGFFGEKYVK